MKSIVCSRLAISAEPLPLDGLAATPTALLADAHRSVTAWGEPMRNFGGERRFVGEALTVREGSLAQWKALDLARAGQVLVIACGARRNRAEFGAIFVGIAAAKGLAAIVTDGLLRDREEIAGLDIAVFACGSHPASPADDALGTIGLPVDFAGARICTGDIVVGDPDGIALIPRGELAAVLARLEGQRTRERDLAVSAAGASLPPRLHAALETVQLLESPP